MNKKEYYNFTEMKEILEIGRRTLSKRVNSENDDEKIPFYRIGKKLFFKKIEIYQWMKEQKGKKKRWKDRLGLKKGGQE